MEKGRYRARCCGLNERFSTDVEQLRAGGKEDGKAKRRRGKNLRGIATYCSNGFIGPRSKRRWRKAWADEAESAKRKHWEKVQRTAGKRGEKHQKKGKTGGRRASKIF